LSILSLQLLPSSSESGLHKVLFISAGRKYQPLLPRITTSNDWIRL